MDNFDGLLDQLNAEREKVDVSTISFSTRELVRMYEDGELEIDPSYQRKYRWREDTASTFIESIFLGLPIPPIFVATNEEFQWEVVDGLQRISTLILYLSGDREARERVQSSNTRTLGGKSLTLTGLEKLSQLNECDFWSLPKSIQLYFRRQPLQVISLTDKSDRQVRFDLFERLNSGSISLTPQEVRASVFSGEFMDFIQRLSSKDEFKNLLKLQEKKKDDGTAAEEVLKFFAYKNDQISYDGKVIAYLNSYTAKAEKEFDYASEEEVFDRTFSFMSEVFSGGPFYRNRPPYVTPLVQFEACAVGIAKIIEGGGEPILPKSMEWIDDPTLVGASGAGSNTRQKLELRITRARDIFQEGYR